MPSNIGRSLATTTTAVAIIVFLTPAAIAYDPRDESVLLERFDGLSISPKPPTETLRGIVESVDQRHDTLKIRVPERTEEFRVQDGLIFDSVRFGDPVELTVQRIDGAKTIVGLRKQ
jgi:Cu/Ag efflux protein CusF